VKDGRIYLVADFIAGICNQKPALSAGDFSGENSSGLILCR
jgi:hypothetical protein